MLVATFFDDAFSRQFAFTLRTSAKSLGIPCMLFPRAGNPGLADKAAWRSRALLRLLEAHPNEDVLLIDPDSVIHRRPAILLDEQDYDVAIHYDVETLAVSGPIFIRRNELARRMVRMWSDFNRSFPEMDELENLSRLLGRSHLPIAVRRLPVTYAWVERLHRDRHPSASPVITNFLTDHLITGRIRIPGKQ
jgi:hypothetical protein